MHILEYENYEETKKHYDTDFSYNTYPCSIPLDFPCVPMHWHRETEIIYVKSGRGMVNVDGISYPVVKDSIVFILPGRLHSIAQYESESFSYENIIFELELLGGAEDLCAEKYLLPLQSGRLSLPARLTPNDLCYLQAAACLREVEDANRAKLPGYELQVKGALLRFLALLIAQSKALPPAEKASTQRLRAVLQWISAHYSEPVCVADAAALCQCSPNHFMRWFRQMTGQTFIIFLREYRLNAAAEALRTTEDTILSISEQFGFENLSYFNRAFKAHFGMTPRDYRKK